MKKQQALSMIRHTLTFVGGLLVMRGTVDEGTVNELSGAVIALVATVWGIVEKQSR